MFRGEAQGCRLRRRLICRLRFQNFFILIILTLGIKLSKQRTVPNCKKLAIKKRPQLLNNQLIKFHSNIIFQLIHKLPQETIVHPITISE